MSRPSGPWYRKSRSMWYTSIGAKQIPLGITDPTDHAGAQAAADSLVEQHKQASPAAAAIAIPSATPATPGGLDPLRLLQLGALLYGQNVSPGSRVGSVAVHDVNGKKLAEIVVPDGLTWRE